MSWRVVDHITIYRESGMYAKCPNVVRTPSGDLLVLFHRSPYLGYPHHSHPLFDVNACRSEDEGQTWSDPQPVTADPLGGVIDFGTHTLPDGTIYLHASSNELLPARGHATVTFDSPHARAIGEHEDSTWVSRPGIIFNWCLTVRLGGNVGTSLKDKSIHLAQKIVKLSFTQIWYEDGKGLHMGKIPRHVFLYVAE